MNDRSVSSLPGIPALAVLILVGLAAIAGVIGGGVTDAPMQILASVLTLFACVFLSVGLYMVEPNQAAVLTLFGKYVGTDTGNGLRINNPFYAKRKVSLRVRNFEGGKLKVNELDGSPIEIAAVVVWRVVDSAAAVFAVDDYESFVQVQAESALRAMASSHPYDQHQEGQISLRSHSQEISQHLKAHLDERLSVTGVEVIEARISHLAYAPEIAQAMLQRQQANAVIAARTRIVEGAVGMVEMALDRLRSRGVVDLDEERRAQMVSNLLVVLCGDRAATPVINAGSLY